LIESLTQFIRSGKAVRLPFMRMDFAFGAAAVAFFVMLMFSLVQRNEINSGFVYRGDSPSYLVAQLDREYLHLREVLHVARLRPQELDRDAIVLRNDILSSRLELVTHSPVMVKISTHADFLATVAALSRFSAQMDLALAAPTLDAMVLENLLNTLAEAQAPLQALGLTATATMSRSSEVAYRSLLNQNALIIVLSAFQLLFIAVAAWSMWQKNRQLQAESRVLALANQQLLQNEEKLNLAASVFRHAHESIVIADQNALILEVNESFVQNCQYTQQDLLGLPVHCLISEDAQSAVSTEVLLGRVHAQGYWMGERICRRRDGSEYPAMLSISAVRGTDGAVRCYALFFNDITERKKQQQELEYISTYDVLTALPNRSLFRDRLITAVDVCARHKQSVAVGFIDLDGFKEVNDRHGHTVGDQLLIALASRMNTALRAGDSIARLGGDEFIVLITGLDQTDACIPVLERLLAAASSTVYVDDIALQVSASIGVTVFPEDKVNADHLVRHADQAMYHAKKSGKNQFAFFDPAQERAMDAAQATVPEIRLGLQRGEFVLHYQPKVNMQTGETVGVEALIRWMHPVRGLLPPAEFLPHIEGKQISVDLSAWVIEDAFRQMHAWHQEGLRMPVSVNVGALHLQHPYFYDNLQPLMADYPQHRGMLSIEILETSALSDMDHIRTMMQKCQSIGVDFALDDFGTGYSSLSYLSDLPANEVKIDQRFVKDLAHDPNHLSIVDGIVSLTQAFRRKVVAEGVETAEVGALLLGLGCHLGQGYFIARPMPAAQLAGWLAAWKPPESWRAKGA